MTRTHNLVESALLTALAVVMFFASDLPFAGIVIAFLSPVPLVVLGLRNPRNLALMGLACAAVIVLLVQGPVSTAYFTLGFGVLGVVLGQLVKSRRSAVEIMLYGSVASLFCKITLFALLYKLTGVNPLNFDAKEMQTALNSVMSWMPMSGENAELMRQQFEQMLQFIPAVMPTILIMASVADCWIDYWISGKVIRRLGGQALPPLPPFETWSFPYSLMFAYIAAFLCILAAGYYPALTLLAHVGKNIQMLVSTLFLIQGMAVGTWYLKRKGFGKGAVVTFVIFAMFFPLVSQLTLMAGMFDICWKFRQRIR